MRVSSRASRPAFPGCKARNRLLSGSAATQAARTAAVTPPPMR